MGFGSRMTILLSILGCWLAEGPGLCCGAACGVWLDDWLAAREGPR